MKTLKFSIPLLVIIFIMGCSKKEKQEEQLPEWKELDSFHMIMAEAFHPLKDSGNLAPVKQMINDIADQAAKWAAAPLPKKVDNADMKSKIEKLKTDTRSLANEMAKGATDEMITEKLTALHDQFHQIMEAWHGEAGAEREEEHEEGEEHHHH